MDVEIYKYDPPRAIGFKYIGVDVGARKKNMDGALRYMPKVTVDLEIERVSGETRLRFVPYVDNIQSGILKALFYLFVGIFGYHKNRQYIRQLGVLVEKYV